MSNTKLADIVAATRIPASAAMLLSEPLSSEFKSLYALCGASDVLDEMAERGLDERSELGEVLNSIADAVFTVCVLVGIGKKYRFSRSLWAGVILSEAMRLTSYAAGLIKYGTFPALHTVANKVSDVIITAAPLLYKAFGRKTAGIVICTVSLISAAEELAITVSSDSLDRNRKSILG